MRVLALKGNWGLKKTSYDFGGIPLVVSSNPAELKSIFLCLVWSTVSVLRANTLKEMTQFLDFQLV